MDMGNNMCDQLLFPVLDAKCQDYDFWVKVKYKLF